MRAISSPSKIKKNSSDYCFWFIATALIVAIGWYTPVLAQEIYALSTYTGLEFYQVDKIKKLEINMDHTYGPWVNPTVSKLGLDTLDTGFQTTLNGRIMTMEGRIAWQPTRVDEKFAEQLMEHPGGSTS